MNRFSKILVLSSVLVFLATGCSQSNQPASPSVDRQTQNQQSAANTASTPPVGRTMTKDNPKGPDYFAADRRPTATSSNQTEPPVNPPPPAAMTQGPTITVTQTVQGSNYNKLSDIIPEGETAFDLLKGGHQVVAKDYGAGLGEMVLSIDGTKPDGQHFWEFFVNGKSSNVGASSYKLQNGDKIEWKLSAISSSGYQ